MKSLEELKVEAQKTQAALEAKLAEDRQAIRDAEAAVKAEKARAQLEIARRESEVKAQALVSALQAAGFTDADFSWDESKKWSMYPVIRFDDQTSATRVEFEDVRGRSSWSQRVTGAKVVIGGYGGRTFPMKKDGTFSYEKIAAAVKEIQASQSAAEIQRKKEEARRSANIIIRDRICKAFGLSEWGAVSPAKYVDNKVSLKLEFTLTEAEATNLLNALKTLNLEVR